MNNEVKKIESLSALKIIFGDNYNNFIRIVSSNQDKVKNISTLPLDNYTNNIIIDKDKELLNYVYQNIKYYFDANLMYTPKIKEGMAIFVSKSIVLYSNNMACLRNYFSRGNYNFDREISNPFEEISRLLINAIINEKKLKFGGNITLSTLEKVKREDNSVFEGLSLAVTKNAVCNKMMMYANLDTYFNICDDLELSNIDSSHIVSATTRYNRDVILTQLDRIIDVYYAKLNFEQIITGYPTQVISKELKVKFDNKMIYAKRNIGVYEKTKQLVKKSQN